MHACMFVGGCHLTPSAPAPPGLQCIQPCTCDIDQPTARPRSACTCMYAHRMVMVDEKKLRDSCRARALALKWRSKTISCACACACACEARQGSRGMRGALAQLRHVYKRCSTDTRERSPSGMPPTAPQTPSQPGRWHAAAHMRGLQTCASTSPKAPALHHDCSATGWLSTCSCRTRQAWHDGTAHRPAARMLQPAAAHMQQPAPAAP